MNENFLYSKAQNPVNQVCETPILFLVFNRPDVTKKVFDRIREAKPKYLFIAADGPRVDRPADIYKCQEVREIVTLVDWDCEVKTMFRKDNIGCGKGVSHAITWFFQYVDSGIILEDDCLPSSSFFFFASELLTHYCDNPKVMGITGFNGQDGRKRGSASYYFSQYPGIWGWATWKDRWGKFDYEGGYLKAYLDEKKIKYTSKNPQVKISILKSFSKIGKNNSCGYAWRLTVFYHQGLICVPNQNLISNIGFSSDDATHTNGGNQLADLPLDELGFPLSHPEKMKADLKADDYLMEKFLDIKWKDKLKAKLYQTLHI